MPDPFRNYDSWLSAPYERRARDGELYESACRCLGIEIDPPHTDGGDCPRCGRQGTLEATEDPALLWCEACCSDIGVAEDPSYDPIPAAEEAAADAEIERRYDL